MAKQRKGNQIAESLNLLQSSTFATPDDIEELYRYNGSTYERGEIYVKALLEKHYGDQVNTGTILEVINHLKRRSYVKRESFNEYYGVIPVQNGLLNLETGKLEDFTPEMIFTFMIHANHVEGAKCEKWLRFLEEVQPNQQDRDVLQEYAGYTLIPSMPFHKLAFLVGGGRNGKGVFIRTIEDILGSENVSNIKLDYLNGGHRFIATNLFGKLMNISSEPSTKYPLQTELIKQLTGEDSLEGEVKGKQTPVKFKPFAKHFVLANTLPKVNDKSVGWQDRLFFQKWEQTFTTEKGNMTPQLEKTWLSDEGERSGILNWMLEGLRRLVKNGKFTETLSGREMILEYKRSSDPIGAFLETECILKPDSSIKRDILYFNYKDYAQFLGVAPESKNQFFERIRSVPGVRDAAMRDAEGKTIRVFRGIEVKNPDAESLEDESVADVADVAGFSTRLQDYSVIKEVEKSATSATSATGEVGRILEFMGDREIDLSALCGKFYWTTTYATGLIAGLMRDGVVVSSRAGWFRRAQ